MKKTINLLFVCRHNRFRSKFAESYFKKINKNKNVKIKSAGIFPGTYPLDEREKEVSIKLGAEIKGRPKPVTSKLLKWADLIILITDDIKNPEELFNYGGQKNKFEVWSIGDNYNGSKEKIGVTLKKIMKKTNELNLRLKG